jgi:hypothetical protein
MSFTIIAKLNCVARFNEPILSVSESKNDYDDYAKLSKLTDKIQSRLVTAKDKKWGCLRHSQYNGQSSITICAKRHPRLCRVHVGSFNRIKGKVQRGPVSGKLMVKVTAVEPLPDDFFEEEAFEDLSFSSSEDDDDDHEEEEVAQK